MPTDAEIRRHADGRPNRSDYPVSLVVLRGASRRWWRWGGYDDLFALVTPSKVYRWNGRSTPTHHKATGLRFPKYTVIQGCYSVAFGEDRFRTPSHVLRGEDDIYVHIDGCARLGRFNFMIHPGPRSAGCFILPPRDFPNFYSTCLRCARSEGNKLAYTDVGDKFPHLEKKSPAIPLIVVG